MSASSTDLFDRARGWIEGDPDPQTREALRQLLDEGDEAAVADHVDGGLEFGTAGLRGVVGPGPRRMNRAVVIRTTRGLADHVISTTDRERPLAVVGRDARNMSEEFARDTVGVLVASGFRVAAFPRPVPTPLVAYAAKTLAADTAVVITASHNPPEYNGYKVYAANGAQIIPPEDGRIAAAIEVVGPANEVPRAQHPFAADGVELLDDDLIERYLSEVEATLPRLRGTSVVIAYTPLHGVAGELTTAALRRSGRDRVELVAAQAEPDPGFPTVRFPNPEEPGALDLAVATADEIGADLVLANDPDGDRLAVAIPDHEGWRTLTGNQIGALLGDHLLAAYQDDRQPLVVSSIVSSPMLQEIAQRHGARYEATLTGFKWICNAALALADAGDVAFVFGYEEALGYTIGDVVRDKDGISAAVAFADLAASLGAAGRCVRDRLDDLYRRYGLWVSVQHAVTLSGDEGQRRIDAAMERIGRTQPDELGGRTVTGVSDFRRGADERPWWLPEAPLVRLELEDGSRVLVRPSGTEPKLKFYADLRASLRDDAVAAAEQDLRRDAQSCARELAEFLGVSS